MNNLIEESVKLNDGFAIQKKIKKVSNSISVGLMNYNNVP